MNIYSTQGGYALEHGNSVGTCDLVHCWWDIVP